MPHLIQISDNQHAQLSEIKNSLEKKTGKLVSYKIAFDVYATKKPKGRITVTPKKPKGRITVTLKNKTAYHKNQPQFNIPDFNFGEIKLDATIKKILR